jgi:large subunit ribosomal protein L9
MLIQGLIFGFIAEVCADPRVSVEAASNFHANGRDHANESHGTPPDIGGKDSPVPKTLKLMLTESVESLGIVGDVVNVRVGYARNFLLPRNYATQPSKEAIAAVQSKRADAQKQVAALRKDREEIIKKLQGLEVQMIRSCNDLGHLYASVTQQDIASLLSSQGYAVKARDVRLNTNIKRIDHYDVHIKFDRDLDATVKLNVLPDRKIEQDRRDAVEVDDEGEMIVKKPQAEGEKAAGGEGGEGKPARERKEREPKEPRKRGIDALLAPQADEQKPGTWGKRPAAATAEAPAGDAKSAEKPAKGDAKPEGKGKKKA